MPPQLKAGPPAHCQPHCPASPCTVLPLQALIRGCTSSVWGKHLFCGGFAQYPQDSFDSWQGKAGAPQEACPQLSGVLPPRSHVAPAGRAQLLLWVGLIFFPLLLPLSHIHLSHCTFSSVQGSESCRLFLVKAD